MADIPISVFIDKLISTTNCKSIEWNKLSSSGINLRPLPDDKFAPVTHSYAEEIDPKSSYVASINGG